MASLVGAAVVAAVLLVAAGVVVAVAVPWRVPVPPRAAQLVALSRLPADQVARGRALARELRPLRYAGLLVELVAVLVLGVTPLAARLVTAIGDAVGGGRLVTAVLGGLAVAAIVEVLGLPFAARRRAVLRRYGLITQGWAGWAVDLGRGAVLAVVFVGAALAGFFAATGAWPHAWWAPVGGAAAVLTVLLSMVFPVLVEPLFHRFTPMPDSPLRDDLLALAAADRVRVRSVLVADASRRGSAVNAYVSGLGPTRRIVVFDTLLSAAPDAETRLVVAHELGHARHHDVPLATGLGALGAAAGCCLLYLFGAWPAPFAAAGATGLADPRAVGLLFALLTVAQLVLGPVGNLVSRRVEARADRHALRTTGDPATFAAMQGRLALRNLADVDPGRVAQALFGTHPSTVQRLAAADEFAPEE